VRPSLALLSLGIIGCASSRSAEMGANSARPLIVLQADQLDVAAAAITAVIASLPSEPTTTVCVTLSGPPPASWYTPSTALRDAVARGSRRIVGPNECPPTYQTMFVMVDSAGRPQRRERPPGYVDPYDLIVREPVVVGADSTVVMIDVQQGTRNHYYRCVSYRTEGANPTTQCKKTGTSVSTLPPNETLQLTVAGIAEVGVAAAPVRTVSSPHIPNWYAARS
jgi:hypothetical protein